jgi:hypothetical protein
MLCTVHIFTLLRQTNKYTHLFTIIYLYQYHPCMFRWSGHHHRGAPKATTFVLHLKSYKITSLGHWIVS